MPRKIYPTQKLLNRLFSYRSDGQLILKTRPVNSVKFGDVAGFIHKSSGYRYIKVKYEQYAAHRLIWIMHYGYNPENDVDHINRNRADNRIDNLRNVTQSCNIRNSGNNINNVSGVKGVCWYSRYNKWVSRITINSKRACLGYYEDFKDAVLYRLAAEQCLDWSNCDSSSPAYQYCIKHNLITTHDTKEGM